MVVSIDNNNVVTRASLGEYITVLQQVQTIVNATRAAGGTASVEFLVSQAQMVSALLQQLSQMEDMSLVSATKLGQLSQQVTSKFQALVTTVNDFRSGRVAIANAMSAVANDTSLATALTNALDYTKWDLTVGSTTLPLRILDSPQDYAFYEAFRITEAGMNNAVGIIGNKLQAQQKLLDALNLINLGPTWNPGTKYISTSGNNIGQLTDIPNGGSWYDKFVDDKISEQMIQGIQGLNSVRDIGYFTTTSPEGRLIADILAKLSNTDTVNGGYNYAATKQGAFNMWSDTAFRTQVQNGVQLVTNFNDTAQVQMQRVLLTFQQISQTLTKLNVRMSEQVKEIAKKANVNRSG